MDNEIRKDRPCKEKNTENKGSKDFKVMPDPRQLSDETIDCLGKLLHEARFKISLSAKDKYIELRNMMHAETHLLAFVSYLNATTEELEMIHKRGCKNGQ